MPTRPLRQIFQVPANGSLPPFSGPSENTAHQALERLLEELLDSAGANILPAPSAAPDGANTLHSLAALKAASTGYEVAPGIGLADHFWTSASPYHNGAVGKQLALTQRGGRSVQGFLALHVADVRSTLLYSQTISPLRVRDPIGTVEGVGGPFVALVACEGRADGSAEAVAAFALPTLSSGRLMPVYSELDRDVLRALEHLQLTLDAHGIDCTVQRTRPRTPSPATILNVSLTAPTGRTSYFRLAVDPAYAIASARAEDRSVDFTVSPRNWNDGGFVKWLEQTMAN